MEIVVERGKSSMAPGEHAILGKMTPAGTYP